MYFCLLKKLLVLHFDLNTYQIILALFVVSGIVQLFYFLFFYARLMSKKRLPELEKPFPISVIIAARNEEKNLLNFLPLVLEQNYPMYEVVVVNDRSWDESLDVLLALEQKYPHLRIVDIPDVGKDGFAKKMAITIGIKGANYDRLVFTDADCKPVNENWLGEMAKGFAHNKTLVLGAGGYLKQKGFLNKLIRYDANFIAIQYLSFAKAGIPYMGVGRNLAYTKELYDSVRGFKSHYHLISGDDDLFVNEVATKKNTTVVFNEDAVTFSVPKTSFKAWWRQKKRHLTTGGRYKFYQLFLLGLYPLSLFLFYITGITLIAFNYFIYYIIGAIFFRILIQILIFIRPFKLMDSKDLLWMVPFLDIVFLFINPILLNSSKQSTKTNIR